MLIDCAKIKATEFHGCSNCTAHSQFEGRSLSVSVTQSERSECEGVTL